MKILYVLQNFPPSDFGGISKSMYEVIYEINSFNHDLKVLTTSYKLSKCEVVMNKWTKFKGINVIYVRMRNPIFFFKFFLEGFRQINKSDLIHLSSIFFYPSLIFALYSNFLGKPFVLTVHGELHPAALKFKSWKKKPYLFIMSLLLKKSNFLATSKTEFTYIKRYFPESKISIIPNSFKLDLPINERKINQFIFLGRICPIKNIENLIIGCSESKEFRKENFKFLLIGPIDNAFPQYKEKLKKLIDKFDLANNIIFTGEVNSPIKEKLISQSKALFLVSHSENFGNVVIDSLAQGTLVVASKGAPWQELETWNCGFWIESSSKVIALAIDDLILMNKQTYDEMSDNALLLSKEYTTAKIIPMWLKLNLEILTHV